MDCDRDTLHPPDAGETKRYLQLTGLDGARYAGGVDGLANEIAAEGIVPFEVFDLHQAVLQLRSLSAS